MKTKIALFAGAHEFQVGNHIARFVLNNVPGSADDFFWDGDLREGFIGSPLNTGVGQLAYGGPCSKVAAFDAFVTHAQACGVKIPEISRARCEMALRDDLRPTP